MKEFFKLAILVIQTFILAVILGVLITYGMYPESFGIANAKVVKGFKTEIQKP